jgi:hypothetical protein
MAKVNSGYERASSLSVIKGKTLTKYSLLDAFDAGQEIIYGFLYNWYATQDQGGGVNLIPDAMRAAGWGIPTVDAYYDEFEDRMMLTGGDLFYLQEHLGGDYLIVGGKLKETGFTHWDTPNTGATNEVGFNGRGGGYRNIFGFGYLKQIAIYALNYLTYNEHNVFYIFSDDSQLWDDGENNEVGVSIRLVRPATLSEQALTDGTACDPYIGNDGKVYRTVKIGTQVWLADNLAETKWSDGNWIAGFDGGTYTPISNAAWAALTTAALCAYDDDLANVIADKLYSAITSTQLAELSLTDYNDRVADFIAWVNEQEGFDVTTFETNSERELNETACPIPSPFDIIVSIDWTDTNQDADDGMGGTVDLLDSLGAVVEADAITQYGKTHSRIFTIVASGDGKIGLSNITGYIDTISAIVNVRWRIDGGAWTESTETSLIEEAVTVNVEVQTQSFT